MSIPLKFILDRLKDEKLSGPEITEPPRKDLNPNKRLPAVSDSGAKDPRWFELFFEYFIDSKNEVSDDILFFVKESISTKNGSAISLSEIDRVIVRRRVEGQAPSFDCVIDWKQSFYLNLICQLPCTLTVSVCKKIDAMQTDSQIGVPAKAGMVASKRITKKVFAAPYKSRMDIKDALMDECSYPFVYYTINDFESELLHLTLERDEYLCVELSISIPLDNQSESYSIASELIAKIPILHDPSPFPTLDGYIKCILFQGAVSFAALSSVYQQRGVAYAEQMKNGWGKFADAQASNKRIEYVLMRGPYGKGQCQVAVQEPPGMQQIQKGSMYAILKNMVKTQFSQEHELSDLKAPEIIDCSITYVNVPWQSVANDLLDLSFEAIGHTREEKVNKTISKASQSISEPEFKSNLALDESVEEALRDAINN